MSYRPYLGSGVLRQMQGLPEQAFDMLVTLLARICDDPYDPVFSAPTGVPRRRVADVGDLACYDDEGLGKQLAEEYTAAAWSWWARASLRRRHGGRGCRSRCCDTATATCWPAWHGAKPDLQRASPQSRRPIGTARK